MRYDTDHWFSKVKLENASIWQTGDEWLNRWEEVEHGGILVELSGMKRLSIWNELPY
jgi:hypothetical protein